MMPIDERSYLAGRAAAFRTMLGECLRNLPAGEQPAAQLVAERHETVQILREVCAEFGDNDWPDTLHLADVIEKHLYDHLVERARDSA